MIAFYFQSFANDSKNNNKSMCRYKRCIYNFAFAQKSFQAWWLIVADNTFLVIDLNGYLVSSLFRVIIEICIIPSNILYPIQYARGYCVSKLFIEQIFIPSNVNFRREHSEFLEKFWMFQHVEAVFGLSVVDIFRSSHRKIDP